MHLSYFHGFKIHEVKFKALNSGSEPGIYIKCMQENFSVFSYRDSVANYKANFKAKQPISITHKEQTADLITIIT